MNVALNKKENTLVDILWGFYILQNVNVKKAFRQRIETEDNGETEDALTISQQKMVKESFTNAYADLLAGKVKHNARNLFANK
ncbi:MAG: hypothetical protein II937_01815 [Bacteroidales bacterium]|nr:hypothetical protein [Bacteroidales bacterium]